MTGATDDGTGWGGEREKDKREDDARKDGTRSIVAWEDEERRDRPTEEDSPATRKR